MTNDAINSPVLLALYDGVIAFSEWTEVENSEQRGIAAKCLDGSSRFYVASSDPTYGECLGMDPTSYEEFDELRKATLEAGGWDEADELPWADYGNDGDLLPETDTLESLGAWLNSPLGSAGWTDWEISQMEHLAAEEATIYAPGLQIYAALSSQERSELALAHADLGGPASSVPCVRSKASLDKLNGFMGSRNLEFLFVAEYPHQPD